MNQKRRTLDIKEAEMCMSCGDTPFKDIDLYIIEISQGIINQRTLREFGGMTMLVGGHPALADMFVARRNIANLMPAVRVTLCHKCFLMEDHSLAALWEKGIAKQKEESEKA